MPRQQWFHTSKQVTVETWNHDPAQAFHSRRQEKAACPGLLGHPSPWPWEWAPPGTSALLSWAFEDFFPGVRTCLLSPLVQENKAWILGANCQSLKSPLPFLPKEMGELSLVQIRSLGLDSCS